MMASRVLAKRSLLAACCTLVRRESAVSQAINITGNSRNFMTLQMASTKAHHRPDIGEHPESAPHASQTLSYADLLLHHQFYSPENLLA